MKRLFLVAAIGLGCAWSVGGQTTTTKSDENQESAQPSGKAKVEKNIKADEGKGSASRAPSGRARVEGHSNVRTNGGGVWESTTVIRNGRETREHHALHRSSRERTNVHFRIGTHPRDWWLRTYTIVLVGGCHYFLADDGCWYPAYGFDPTCDYPAGVVYCE